MSSITDRGPDVSGWRFRRWAAAAGVAGPVALVVYFTAPALVGWPYAGGSADQVAAFARSHETLFYAGAWLQATGTLLSVVFFLALVLLARATACLSGLVVIVGSASLLAVVLVEAAFLVAVPIAAANNDNGTVATAFAMSNGVFVRVFPLAPASATLIGLGAILRRGDVLDRRFGTAALGIGAAFVIGGVISVFATAGLLLIVLLSVGQAIWTAVAAINLGTRSSI
jgi:hypothetical protein